jgi:hypothetical protein
MCMLSHFLPRQTKTAGPNGVHQLQRPVRAIISAASLALMDEAAGRFDRSRCPNTIPFLDRSAYGTHGAEICVSVKAKNMASLPSFSLCPTVSQHVNRAMLRAHPRSLRRYPGFCRQVKKTQPKGMLPRERRTTFVPEASRSAALRLPLPSHS